MLARLMIAILLLGSHTLPLRAAMVASGPATQEIASFACCPLCLPASDDRQSMGCGCGCGDAQRDDRVPRSPEDLPGILNSERGLPNGERPLMRVFTPQPPIAPVCVGVNDDASGHGDTLRFLARVGVWLN